ncbi:hypothetical protein BDA99DRAFT_497633 [Phascolomyces articulosus]|uniref:Secreted protein n=1 Tax=Phascolomyces articulosus TaxID=60185 RepID=A0AAD5K8L2_9FUNG|nr:hypothetical protein BDA99DRAFT_497633 [Phascolomyces articulosus]
MFILYILVFFCYIARKGGGRRCKCVYVCVREKGFYLFITSLESYVGVFELSGARERDVCIQKRRVLKGVSKLYTKKIIICFGIRKLVVIVK